MMSDAEKQDIIKWLDKLAATNIAYAEAMNSGRIFDLLTVEYKSKKRCRLERETFSRCVDALELAEDDIMILELPDFYEHKFLYNGVLFYMERDKEE